MKKWAVVILILMTSMACAQSTDSATFKSIWTSRDSALETDPQSAFWHDASPVYFEADNYGRIVPGLRTEVRSRWTKGGLYFLFICPYRKLNLKPSPQTDGETNYLWNWDVAEVFIGADLRNIRRYKEFEMSPQGEWLDLDIADHRNGWKWNSGFEVAARIDREQKIWYGAMRIPFTAIDPNPPRPGTMFRVNLFRGQGPAPDKKLLAWQTPMSDTFHVPERFGRLMLVEHK